MKELQEILKKVSDFAPDEKAILATVVDVQGSGYRRAGARMLIDENGYSIGTVSGGCLEADVLERAKKVLETGEPCLITYDTTKDENSLFGLGMGCRGIVRILLEEISRENLFFNRLRQSFNQRKSFEMATLISSESASQKIGLRLFSDNSETFGDDFKSEISNLISEKLAANFSGLTSFDFGEVFFENINPPLNLMIFGAGYDAIPLIKFAKELGWRVSIVDHRPAFANTERLPEADGVFALNIQDLDDSFFQDENSATVLMTHNYERDREILPHLLRSNCFYIGALGPKKRTEKILKESVETFTNEQLAKLYAPIGLDIGANSPEAIALAIVAEINAVLSNRNGGFLRNRQGSIYER